MCYAITSQYVDALKDMGKNILGHSLKLNKRLYLSNYIKENENRFIFDDELLKEDLTLYITNEKQDNIYKLCNQFLSLQNEFDKLGINKTDLFSIISDKEINFNKILEYGKR